ncbi:uncharacterized protein KY384_004621 [Bacidia gigantensis]|uniref:uncharacterized protein n=1 Tax=Bacidia gigantensis TaxID=2732470 RepID=UPI001D05C0E5|nr:uncharacterized protein KY384_004621 [Bacidia gigantensis]KAG8531263.1 hypothetical protein KY384_004621 [Bacidia gigantensis]
MHSAGIDYPVPDSPYRLHYYNLPPSEWPFSHRHLALSAIEETTAFGANIFDYLIQHQGPSIKINFKKSGALGGIVNHGSVSIHIDKVPFFDPTYDDAFWIMKGMEGAAREKGSRKVSEKVELLAMRLKRLLRMSGWCLGLRRPGL